MIIWDLELFEFGIWNFGFGIYFEMKFRRRILIKSSKNFRSLSSNSIWDLEFRIWNLFCNEVFVSDIQIPNPKFQIPN